MSSQSCRLFASWFAACALGGVLQGQQDGTLAQLQSVEGPWLRTGANALGGAGGMSETQQTGV